MTSGIPTDAADDSVQANIVSMGYGGATGSTGSLNPGSEISLRATTSCCTADYIRHQNNAAVISSVTSSSSSLDKNDATWIVRRGLASSSCVSFESRNYPGDFLRHYNYNVYIASNGGSNAFDSATSWANDVSWVVSQPWAP